MNLVMLLIIFYTCHITCMKSLLFEDFVSYRRIVFLNIFTFTAQWKRLRRKFVNTKFSMQKINIPVWTLFRDSCDCYESLHLLKSRSGCFDELTSISWLTTSHWNINMIHDHNSLLGDLRDLVTVNLIVKGTEVEFVHPVSAGGSVKFLPAV